MSEYLRQGKREIRPYHFLIRLADLHIQAAKAAPQHFEHGLAANLFLALALEAYVNHIGKERVGCWDSLERRLSLRQKVEVLADKLSLGIGFSERPWQELVELVRLRNMVAHAKTMVAVSEVETVRANEEPPLVLDFEWERYCEYKWLEKARFSVREMARILCGERAINFDPFAFGGTTEIAVCPDEGVSLAVMDPSSVEG